MVSVAKGIEGRVDKFAVRLGIFQFLEFLHTLVVIESFRLHLRNGLRLDLVQLFPKNQFGILQDGFNEREQDQGIIRCLRINQRDGLQR